MSARTHTASSSCQSSKKSVFVFGLGYTTLGLTRLLMSDDWTVTGTVRNPGKARTLAQPTVFVYDPAAGVSLGDEGRAALQAADYVISSIPPLAMTLYDPVIRDQIRLMQRCTPRWFGYLSSTGVYGDWGGAWVDERSELRAASGKGVLRVEHEQAWSQQHAATGLPLHIFRLAGIYGPGRSVLTAWQQERLSESQQRRGRQQYVSRCHVYDICRALHASMLMPSPGAVYNVADDDPAPRSDVVAYARQLVLAPTADGGILCPSAVVDETVTGARQQEEQGCNAAAGGGSRRGALEEKRVSNSRLKDALHLQLCFPTYKEGLAALRAGDNRPFAPTDLEWLV